MSLPTVSLLLFVSVVAPGGSDSVSNRTDLLYGRRDRPSSVTEARALLEAALSRTPSEYELLWRAARIHFWMSDDPSSTKEQRSQWGKTGWDFAERAIAASPGRPEGYYWAAVSMGSYALGLGAMRSLTMGLEAKFRDRLGKAAQLSPPGYQFGGVDIAWGRFYEKLPWPKRDRKKAEMHLRRVLTTTSPRSLRARVYLADTLAETGRSAEAMQLLGEVAAAKIGAYDPPEESRAKVLSESLMISIRSRR